jgi:hypothetical protein
LEAIVARQLTLKKKTKKQPTMEDIVKSSIEKQKPKKLRRKGYVYLESLLVLVG